MKRSSTEDRHSRRSHRPWAGGTSTALSAKADDGDFLRAVAEAVLQLLMEADSGNRWTVPFGGGVGKLAKVAGQPIDIKGQVFWNAEKPDGAASWAAQLQVKFLFPK